MDSLSALTDLSTTGRHACPWCGSSDGLSISDDVGDTGAVHCFSCEQSASGATFLAEQQGWELSEALRRLGVPGDYDRPAQQQAQARRQRTRSKRQRENHYWLHRTKEIERLKAHMTEIEHATWRTLAPCHPDDLDAAEAAVAAYERRVLERIRSEQNTIDCIDTHYDEC